MCLKMSIHCFIDNMVSNFIYTALVRNLNKNYVSIQNITWYTLVKTHNWTKGKAQNNIENKLKSL